MKAILFLTVIFTTISGFTQSQISGMVTDKKNNPLIGARIIISGTYDGTVANTDGAYSFKTQQSDSVTVLVQFMGFET